MTSLFDCSPRRVRLADLSFAARTFLRRPSTPLGRNLGRLGATALFAAAALLAGGSGVSAQTTPALQAGWNQVSPATVPPERMGSAMAYDAAHGQLVMFGGFGHRTVLNDTWLWSGSNWTQANPTTSSLGRFGASMAYDAALGEVILFGGEDLTVSIDNDTWAWNDATWTQLTPANSPPARVPYLSPLPISRVAVSRFGVENRMHKSHPLRAGLRPRFVDMAAAVMCPMP
jgi:hypothetical protein